MSSSRTTSRKSTSPGLLAAEARWAHSRVNWQRWRIWIQRGARTTEQEMKNSGPLSAMRMTVRQLSACSAYNCIKISNTGSISRIMKIDLSIHSTQGRRQFPRVTSFSHRLAIANGIFNSKFAFLISVWGGCEDYLLDSLQIIINKAMRVSE